MNYANLFRVTLPETVLELAALLVLVVDLAFLRKAALKTRASVAALLGVLGCVAAVWAQYWSVGAHSAWGYQAPGTGEMLLFNLRWAGVSQVAILILTALTLVLLPGSKFTRHVGEYVAVVLMSATGGVIISGAQDLLVIFIGLELLSLGLYILTAFAKQSGKSAEAAIKYYLFGGMSAAFLLFGFSYLYGLSGSTSLQQVEQAVSLATISNSPLLYVALVAVAAGLGFKVAAFPFHMWAPDAYEGAPAPAAAFIASVSKVASFALLITICSVALPRQWSLILVVLSAASMFAGNLAALAQVSVRRLLAYSAIAHAGYILLGLAYFRIDPSVSWWDGAKAFGSANAILYYILTYGLTTIGAFGVVGVVERATGTDRFDAFLGLHKRNPLLAGVLLVLFLSLAGIPPLVGFWAKFNLFAAVLGASAGVVPFALVALAVAFSAVSLYYYLQVLKRAYVMPATDATPIKVDVVTMAALLLIAAGVVVFGCFPGPLQNWIASFYPVM
jgi:NADH-quinone oxidoreductase subunit N